MKESLIFAVAIVLSFSYIVWNINDNIAKLNDRIDHLYTERGFNELKCQAAGGEWVEESSSGWQRTFDKEKGEWNEGESVAYYKRGCFSQLHKVSDVEIKI